MEINLNQFLKNGKFGQIELYWTKSQIEERVGAPDYWLLASTQNNKKENSPIWRYGNVEFHFNSENQLKKIYNDYLDTQLFGGENLQFSGSFLLDGKIKTLKTVKKHLFETYLSFEMDQNKDLAITYLKLESGVHLLFRGENEDYKPIKNIHNHILFAFEYSQPSKMQVIQS